MSLIKLYVDEDAMDTDLTAITVPDAGLIERPDDEQLAFATGQGVSSTLLHTDWLNRGRDDAGIILAPQQRFSVGEQLRRISRLRSSSSVESMRNHIEFLSNWS